MKYYENTNMFRIIQDKVKELDKKCIVIIGKKDYDYSNCGMLHCTGIFGGLSQFIKEDLSINGFSIVSFNKKNPKLIFDKIKTRPKIEDGIELYCCLLDKNGEVVEDI
jgi:hypothetical protein